jgi:hypothetical protein
VLLTHTIQFFSPAFDPQWATNGLLEKAANLMMDWVKKQTVEGLQLELAQLPGRTPLIFAEVAGKGAAAQDTVLLYGHLDKQPPLSEGWVEGTGPYTPVIKDGKVFYVRFAFADNLLALRSRWSRRRLRHLRRHYRHPGREGPGPFARPLRRDD